MLKRFERVKCDFRCEGRRGVDGDSGFAACRLVDAFCLGGLQPNSGSLCNVCPVFSNLKAAFNLGTKKNLVFLVLNNVPMPPGGEGLSRQVPVQRDPLQLIVSTFP